MSAPGWWRRLRGSSFWLARRYSEIDEEIEFHLEARSRDRVAAGLKPDEAREEAIRRFGDPETTRTELRALARERQRAEDRAELVDELRQDLGYAVRVLVRRPGFAAVAILTLGLGIGATTAIFTVLDGIVLRPLPFADPDRLVVLWGTETGMRTGSSYASYPDFVDFESSNRVFEGMAGASAPEVTLTGDGGEPTRVPAGRVSHDFFELLGVAPLLGRGIAPEEDRIGGDRVVVLGHGLWRDRYGADAGILGRAITLNGLPYTVIGVMPPGFDFPLDVRLWLPLLPEHGRDHRSQHRILAFGRMRPDVTLEQANADVEAIAARLEREHPEENTNRSARVEPLHEVMVGDVRPALLILFGAVGLVLLIACVNVANLLLARASARQREVAVRCAMGAGRARLARQLLTETLVLAMIGGAVGIALAYGGVELLVALGPADLPRLDEVAVDGRVLGFALAVTILPGLAFGLFPALQATAVDLHGALKEGVRTASSGRRRSRFRQALVVSEVALAVILVIGAGLFLHSLLRVQRVDPGFTARNVLVVPLALPLPRYPQEEPARVVGFYEELIGRVRALPGVEAAAASYQHPLAGGWESSFQIRGVVEAPPGERPEARVRPVTPGYFETAGIRLLRGRAFSEADRMDAPGAMIVNESFVRAFLPDRDPLGHVVVRGAWWPGQPEEFTIVGVVNDVKMDGLTAATPWSLYFAHAQFPFNDMNLVVRTSGDPRAILPAIPGQVHALDANLPVENVRTLAEIRSALTAPERFRTMLMAAFAALALILASIGIYGVLAYAVAQRSGEIGVRMSLGARAADVIRLIVGQGLRLTLVGVVIGLTGAYFLARTVARLLFEVAPGDPLIFGTVPVLLVLVAVAASLIPAARAARVDPVSSLRSE